MQQFSIGDITQSYLKGLHDCLKPRMLALMCVPIVVAAVFVWFFWGQSMGFLDSLAQSYALVDASSNAVWAFLLNALLTLVNSLIGFLCFVVAVVLVQLVLSIFYAPYLLAYLHKHYYPNVRLDEGLGILESILALLKILALFGCLFLLCIPLYFIPVVNGFVIFVLLFLLFKATMSLDVIGSLFSQEASQQLHKQHRIELFIFTFGLYALSLIPVVNFFVAIFQILCFGHYAFIKKLAMQQPKGA